MDLSFQLYSARNVASQTGFLTILADLGYTQVEGFFGNYADPAAYKAALDAVRLTMPSAHFLPKDLENDFNRCHQIAQTLGVKNIYAPHLAEADRPKDRAGWVQFAKSLAELGKKLQDHGYRFGWHNHDFEFVPLKDEPGSIPMQIILDEAPNIDWEIDVAWIIVSGQDPMEWIQHYGSRISAVHVKDMAPEGQMQDEDGWADIGLGTMDWVALHAKFQQVAPKTLYIMEHDNPSDAGRFAKTSIATFKTYQ